MNRKTHQNHQNNAKSQLNTYQYALNHRQHNLNAYEMITLTHDHQKSPHTHFEVIYHEIDMKTHSNHQNNARITVKHA